MNLFVTNIPAPVIPVHSIFEIYKLRWQIELIFKIWKSVIKIHNFKDAKKERIETVIIAKLILILLNWKILSCFCNSVFKNIKKSISYFKAHKTLNSIRAEIMTCLRKPKILKIIITKLFEKILYSHEKDKRKNRINSHDILVKYIG